MSPAGSVFSKRKKTSGGFSFSPQWAPKGCGLGLRHPHYPLILETRPKVDWFEAISENFMDSGGRPIRILEKVREYYPIAIHGTALSIGSVDPLNKQYLKRLKQLADRMDPFIVSDHLCWSGVEGEQLHDLLPLPFTAESVRHVVRRVQEVQESLKRVFVIENVSTYVTFRQSEMTEWEFVAEIARRSGCGLLIDINNVYVNSKNHHFDPLEYLKHIPASYVAQIHLAGHTDMGGFLFDTHSAPVIDDVWQLYRKALNLWGPVSTLIEWDEHIPSLEKLTSEADKAKIIYSALPNDVPAGEVSRHSSKTKHSHRDVVRTPTLAKAQKIFKSRMHSFITDGRDVKANKLVDNLLNPQGGVPASERMSVYANGYPARVHEALGEVFEAVRRAVGVELFGELTHAYARKHAPNDSDYNLNNVGCEFAVFLSKNPVLKKFPFLTDLARLEWQVWQAFHAFDEKPARQQDIAKVAARDWEKARFIFQPSVSLVIADWDIFNLWKEKNNEKSGVLPTTRKKQYLLVGRSEEKIRVETLEPKAYFLAKGLLQGRRLGDVCETLAGQVKDPSQINIAAWFNAWISNGLIASLNML